MEDYVTNMQSVELGMYSGEYYEWLKISNSYQGWLLTLNDFEFFELNALVADYMEGVENDDIGSLVLLTGFKKIPEDGTPLSKEEFDKFLRLMATSTMLISLAKRGLATYIKADEDMDWRFSLTEKGKELAEMYNSYVK